MTFEELKIRILEIINNSLNEFNNLEETSSEKVKEKFDIIMSFLISKKYSQEFLKLLSLEQIMFDFKERPYLTNKNLRLKNMCIKRINSDDKFKEYYRGIVNIIEKVIGSYAYQIEKIRGYYILKEDVETFISLCEFLKIEEFINWVDDMDSMEQINRITLYKEENNQLKK